MNSKPLALVVVAVLGCQSTPKELDKPGAPKQRFESAMMVRFHMGAHFELLRAIQRLTIRGKLAEARLLARSIADAPNEAPLGPLEPYALQVRDLAASLALAPNIDEAARREARLAVACAACHKASNIVPRFAPTPALPPDHPSDAARMARHLWATDRLWEATVGGGDEPWTRGLEVLAETPLPFGNADAQRVELARKLRELAYVARKPGARDTMEDRGRVYGEILVVCAGCHTLPAAFVLPSQR